MEPENEAEADLSPEEKLDAIVDMIPDDLEEAEAGDPAEVIAETSETEDETRTETDVTDPATPVIAPPDSWTAEARAKFAALPPDLQAVIAEREREQKSAFNRQVNEVAEAKKAAETERQRLVQQLDVYLNAATNFDPVIAEGTRTDWAKLAREDPVSYVEKKAAFDQRVGELRNAQMERQRLAEHDFQETRVREANALREKVPEWSDVEKYKADWTSMKEIGRQYGLTDQELEGINDHRLILGLRDAMLYRQMVKAQQTIQQKKVVVAPKVQKPGGGEAPKRDTAQALKGKLANTSGLHAQAEILASMIED